MRPDGFPTADHDVGFLTDDRVLDAADAAGPLAVVAYIAVRDASWARGDRVPFDSAVRRLPTVYGLGDVDESDRVRDALEAVGLLDPEGRIPSSTWTSWYGAASDRRELRRELGRRGGLAKARNRASSARASPNGKHGPPSSSASGPVQLSSSQALPDRPSVVATDVATDGTVVPVDPTGPDRLDDLDDLDGPVTLGPVTGSVTIYCSDYRAHQSEHYRPVRGGPFVCRVCGPAPGPSFGDRMAANGLAVDLGRRRG